MNYLNLFLILGFFIVSIMYLYMYIYNTETFQQMNR